MSPLPLNRPWRPRWQRRGCVSHDRGRVASRYFGPTDPWRVEFYRGSVGAASWLIPFANLFGNPFSVTHLMPRLESSDFRIAVASSRNSEMRPEKLFGLFVVVVVGDDWAVRQCRAAFFLEVVHMSDDGDLQKYIREWAKTGDGLVKGAKLSDAVDDGCLRSSSFRQPRSAIPRDNQGRVPPQRRR
jgi:hypothetical protein